MRVYNAACECCVGSSTIIQGVFQEKRVRNAFYSVLGIVKAQNTKPMLDFIVRGSSEYFENIVVDSGAHSFFSQSHGRIGSAGVQRRKTAIPLKPSEYFVKYLRWLLDNQGAYDYFVELDIGEIVGQPTVERWRKVIEQHGLIERCIVVHHPVLESDDEFLRRIKDVPSRYVGLEGIRSGGGDQPAVDYAKCTHGCYDAGVLVHGFAMVRHRYVSKVPFASVDSISWKAPLIYGGVYVYDAKRPYSLSLLRDYKRAASILASNVRQISHSDLQVIANADKMGTSGRRAMQSAALRLSCATFERFAENITRAWEMRGVDWKKVEKAVWRPRQS